MKNFSEQETSALMLRSNLYLSLYSSKQISYVQCNFLFFWLNFFVIAILMGTQWLVSHMSKLFRSYWNYRRNFIHIISRWVKWRCFQPKYEICLFCFPSLMLWKSKWDWTTCESKLGAIFRFGRGAKGANVEEVQNVSQLHRNWERTWGKHMGSNCYKIWSS